jgi:ABC-type branched-subunit amino acid transport system ATPase component
MTATTAAELTATSISKRFGGLSVLDGLDLTIRTGEVTALIGPNGAGKTTLFNVITGALPPDAGAVDFHGQDTSRLPQFMSARLGIGRTYQDLRLFPEMTVADNIAVYAQRPASQSLLKAMFRPLAQRAEEGRVAEAVHRSIERFGISHLARRRAGEVSYAQQKLVTLARLFAADASLLLLDEPASGLDGAERTALIDAVRRLAADGLTVCIVEHSRDVVRSIADRVCFLAQGRVLAEGSPDQVFAASELADIYFGGGARAHS